MLGSKLDRVYTIKDLGVTISSNLKPSDHCQRVANAAHFKCSLILRSFVNKEPTFLLNLFNTYVLSRLHYASAVWDPWLVKDIKMIESVLRKFTKRIPSLKELPYKERLRVLNMHSLEYIRLHSALIFMYSVLNDLTPLKKGDFFDLSAGNSRQILKVKTCNHDFRKHFWAFKNVNVYNALPGQITSSPTCAVFKRKLAQYDRSRFFKVFDF